jgi:UDP-N-acetylmuramate--alanine ligase|tara:strand:+ start:2618 stop:3991 length:1374 start_codon:yes stop_codon:yes gene_type:complete
MKNKIKKIHFIGIGGSGMSGIAEVMHNLGFRVSGSDAAITKVTKELKKMGITVYPKHAPANVAGVDVIVASTAISKNNIEIKEGKNNNIPIIPRAEMLSELMRFKKGIAVAGTHGKTSTTSLLASILSQGGLDPTFVIGGRINSMKANAKLGEGDIFVVEADESDASFLHLNPINTIVTNIDRDHLETYQGDFERLKATYLDFIHQVPFYSNVFLCIDDSEINNIIPNILRPIVTYGLSSQAQIQAISLVHFENKMTFVVHDKRYTNTKFDVSINLPGIHYVNNTLAAIAVGLEYGVSIKHIQKALKEFEGVARRYDVYRDISKNNKNFIVIDDYGHHPTEIRAVLEATKKGFPNKDIALVFQPHRYTRTKDCYDDFLSVFQIPLKLFLFDIYSAGEEPIPGISSEKLLKDITRADAYHLPNGKRANKIILDNITKDSIIVIMGAGSVGNFASQFIS